MLHTKTKKAGILTHYKGFQLSYFHQDFVNMVSFEDSCRSFPFFHHADTVFQFDFIVYGISPDDGQAHTK